MSTPRAQRLAVVAAPQGVHVEGYDDMLVRMARCCTPVPGDDIIGFVTRGRGVSVHRHRTAPNASSLAGAQAERIIDVDWDTDAAGALRGTGRDQGTRPRAAVAGRDRDAVGQPREHPLQQSHCGHDRVSKMRFEFELGDPSHLDTLLNRLRTIDSVYDAYRVVPGAVSARLSVAVQLLRRRCR